MEEATKIIKKIRSSIIDLYNIMNNNIEEKEGGWRFDRMNKYLPDFVEWYVVRKMELYFAKPGQEIYDATDKPNGKGNKYQIKYTKKREGEGYTSSPDNVKKGGYHYLIVVVLDERNDNPIEIYSIPKKIVNKYRKEYHGGSFRCENFIKEEKNYREYCVWKK